MYVGASGYVVRVLLLSKLSMVRAEPSDHTWDARSLFTQWVPGGNTGEVRDSEESNWPPYLIMSVAQDKVSSLSGTPQCTESYTGLTFIFMCAR